MQLSAGTCDNTKDPQQATLLLYLPWMQRPLTRRTAHA
jgi:hypothetical protein